MPYSVVFPAALAFFHLARAAAASLALTAGLLRRSLFLAGLEANVVAPFIRAHLARCAAPIRARAAADMRRFFGAVPVEGVETPVPSPPPAIESIWLCRASIRSLMEIIRLSCTVVKLARFIIGDW
jgi:hypothetical protein